MFVKLDDVIVEFGKMFIKCCEMCVKFDKHFVQFTRCSSNICEIFVNVYDVSLNSTTASSHLTKHRRNWRLSSNSMNISWNCAKTSSTFKNFVEFVEKFVEMHERFVNVDERFVFQVFSKCSFLKCSNNVFR